jgi:L-fucose mutarotase/ribose pyranase (RbsD/FucU family)
MLKEIPKILTPDLFAVLTRMGYCDEIIIADANFTGWSILARGQVAGVARLRHILRLVKQR